MVAIGAPPKRYSQEIASKHHLFLLSTYRAIGNNLKFQSKYIKILPLGNKKKNPSSLQNRMEIYLGEEFRADTLQLASSSLHFINVT